MLTRKEINELFKIAFTIIVFWGCIGLLFGLLAMITE